MKLDLELREKNKAAINKQALPQKYFPYYVAYTWTSGSYTYGPYLLGWNDLAKADEVCDGFKSMGREAIIIDTYPFELGII